MIKLIVGLGNPGQNYEKTRHNVGFLFLDELIRDAANTWSMQSKFEGLFSEVVIAGTRVMLLKPTTFMNRSGQSVAKIAKYYKIESEEILVVHDELDFNPGIIKLKKGGGHAGHNGLRDIILHLNSKEFYRLRVGIGRPAIGKIVADFVLSAPSKAEFTEISKALNIGLGYMPSMMAGDLSLVMNKINS